MEGLAFSQGQITLVDRQAVSLYRKSTIKTNMCKESQHGVINLPEDEPDIIKLLVQYLYENEYGPLLPAYPSAVTASTSRAEGMRPLFNRCGTAYSYSFPHSCKGQGTFCNERLVCPHHICRFQWQWWDNTGACNFRCQDFICNKILCQGSTILPFNGNADQLLIHAKMYEIADKYDVLGLKDLATENFNRACQ